jgi:hypothetical protein
MGLNPMSVNRGVVRAGRKELSMFRDALVIGAGLPMVRHAIVRLGRWEGSIHVLKHEMAGALIVFTYSNELYLGCLLAWLLSRARRGLLCCSCIARRSQS